MIEIRTVQGLKEAELCAHMMANSEPWITLRRTKADSLSILNDPTREVYVAVEQNQIVGFIILVMQGAFVGYIQSICVAPARRGQQIGHQLMAFAEERILKETPNIFICVSSFNPRVQALYKRLGYEIIGELKEFIVSGHSEILMRKTVTPLSEF